MKIFIFSLLIGATLAALHPTEPGDPASPCGLSDTNAKAEIQIDLDFYSRGLNPAQQPFDFYWVKYEFQPSGRYMRPDPQGCPEINAWPVDWFGRAQSLHEYPGCNWYQVNAFAGINLNCYNDIDGCCDCGYTLETDVDPDENACGRHWLVNFAHSDNDVEYGFYLGFECDQIIVWHIKTGLSVKKTCSGAPDDWYYLSVIYDPLWDDEDVEILVHDGDNGNPITLDCWTNLAFPAEDPAKVHDMVVGAAKNGPGSLVMDYPYQGQVNQICWFNRVVSQAERWNMIWEGPDKNTACYWIGSKAACKFYNSC